MDKLTQAFDFRHACKIFDSLKKISNDDMDYILEAGRKSPSSFGMEPWHFLVITNEALKNAMYPLCYNQAQITSCSHIVIVLYRKANQFMLDSDYLRNTAKQALPSNHSEADLNEACQYFIDYYTHGLPQDQNVNIWSEMQCYIACANMMTAAAYREIDSCAIGGFQHEALAELLTQKAPEFNTNDYGIALCLTFGYRLNPQCMQIRNPKSAVVTYLS